MSSESCIACDECLGGWIAFICMLFGPSHGIGRARSEELEHGFLTWCIIIRRWIVQHTIYRLYSYNQIKFTQTSPSRTDDALLSFSLSNNLFSPLLVQHAH